MNVPFNIIVVPRERFSVAIESLDSILENTSLTRELIYVDGNSPVHVRRELEKRAEHYGFNMVRVDRYLYPNEARNIGLEHVNEDAKYIIFIDNDVIVTPSWLDNLIDCAETTGASIVGPVYLEGEPEDGIVHSAGGEIRIEDVDGDKTVHVAMGGFRKKLDQLGDKIKRQETGLAEFHCMLVRKDMLKEIGGRFDSNLKTTREHVDLCMTARKTGRQIFLEPGSIVCYSRYDRMEEGDAEYYKFRWDNQATEETIRHFEKKWGVKLEKKRRHIIQSRHSALKSAP